MEEREREKERKREKKRERKRESKPDRDSKPDSGSNQTVREKVDSESKRELPTTVVSLPTGSGVRRTISHKLVG
jgi:hypothetical protein